MAEKIKVKKTAKQRFKIFLKTLLCIVLAIAIILSVLACVGVSGVKSNSKFISTLEPVKYENQLKPTVDSDGCYTFVTDEEFKILHLTDIHIGGGFLTINKDSMAINAVAAMISAEKPDLVVVTGDIVYPVPIQSGTFNNKQSSELFAQLMEQLGVYWCLTFGNHDTEIYSYYTREDISQIYSDEKYEHCLYQAGPEDVDGCGNYTVKVKNSKGEITQALIMIDSHAYIGNNPLGIAWKYDCIHENQIEWYEQELNRLKAENNSVMPKSLAFFHIPLQEYQDAWYEYRDNGYADTENVKLIYGEAKEVGTVVYPGERNSGFFDKALELGSTQGMFCGHDHLNNFSLEYKGIRLSYGYSIDYLAYRGIKNYGVQRGCAVINVKPDSSFESHQENYYQDKYSPVKEKEAVVMEDYYSEELNN